MKFFMNKGKTIIWILFSALTFLLGITITYAYLAIRINNNETTSTVAFDAGTMEINYENNSGNIVLNKIIPGASVTKRFTLTGTNNTKINNNNTDNNMYYKIGIVVDNNTFSDSSLKYSLTKDGASTNNGEQANNLTGDVQKIGTRYIASGYFADGASNAKHIYNLTIFFPETGKDQSENQGALFSCHIIIAQDRQIYDYSKTGVEFITNLYNSEEAAVNGLLKDSTVDENIRYSGANPKNYVEFGNDNELWRIIGIFNVTDPNGNKSKKLKIVRNSSLGSFSWDATGNNDYGINNWTDADLMKELNGDYLNYNLTANKTNWYNSSWDSNTQKPVLRQTGTFNYLYTIKEKYQAMISESVWNIGGNNYNPSTEPVGLPTIEQYNAERGNITYKNSRPTTWTGKIGLIYASDYGYASTDAECRNNLRAGQVYNAETNTYDYTNVKCKNNNWLHKGFWYWTLSPCSGNPSGVFGVGGEGFVGTNGVCYFSEVFAVTYLTSDIRFIKGDGTSSSPYKLG